MTVRFVPSVGFDRPIAGKLGVRLATRDVLGVTWRNLLRLARTPQMLLIGAIQAAMLLVLICRGAGTLSVDELVRRWLIKR